MNFQIIGVKIKKRLRSDSHMEKYLLNAPQQPTEDELSLAADLVIRQALRNFRIEKLKEQIDNSLADRNQKEFIHLTNELKNLLQ